MNIYLIGFMGSGKSFTGKKIASALGWRFVDTDRLIEAEYGRSVAEIFETLGESFFREAEKKTLGTLSAASRTVVACGGGTPCSDENIESMKKSGVVLYLKLPAEELVMRLGKSKTTRPLLSGKSGEDLLKQVREMLETRSHWYEKADIVTDAMNTTVDEITVQLADMIRARGAFL